MAARKKAETDEATAQPGTMQPGMMQPGMMQPGMMQPGMMQPGMMQPGMMQPGMMQPGMMQPGMMQTGMAQPGMMQPGMQQPGMQQPGMMQPGMMQPGMQQPGMMQPGMQQPGMMQPGMQQPGMMQPGMPGGFGPMAFFAQMAQMMGAAQGMGFPGFYNPGMDPTAAPFAQQGKADGDPGLDAQIVRPARIKDRVKSQKSLPLGNILDLLCLTEDKSHALGGIPLGCTMVFVGPPGRGKTRTALSSLARVAQTGKKCAFVVAEEGFHDPEGSGRDDLCSRMTKIGMKATGLSEPEFEKQVLENIFVLEAQYHRHNTWDDFVAKYRYLIERENIEFVVIDSLSMIESKERVGDAASPNRRASADNLSALKTYNHERGVTCVCIGQIKDSGEPVGGEALQHTADAVFLVEELSMGSKEMAEQWGSKYREVVPVIRIKKSVTTPTFQHPVRVDRNPQTGELVPHAAQPAEYALLSKAP